MSARRGHPPTLAIGSAPLAGTIAVEASAGTGKTWTIAALVVRLVLERGLSIREVLVVTFTEAATAELRSRVRERFAGLRRWLADGASADDAADDALRAWMLARSAGVDCGEWLRRLDAALNDFDLAPIQTIHAFCQRALAEHAFESGQPFASELVPDESGLVAEVVSDFWRRETAGAAAEWSAWLIDHRVSPATLAQLFVDVERKPWAGLVGAPAAPQPEAELAQAFADAARLWRAESVEVLRQVQEAIERGEAGAAVSADKLPEWSAQLDRYFAGGVASCDTPPALAKLAGKRASRVGAVTTHPFFAAAQRLRDAAQPVAALFAARAVDLKRRAIVDGRGSLARLKRERALCSYNDLVAHLARALDGPQGERLAASLRARYRAVLVDEFQDTDPLQAHIFTTTFGRDGDALYFVGDPKQAIYGFRGADVRAYLGARSRAERRTLLENHRSGPGLVAAVNALFGRDDPFLVPAIDFAPSSASASARARSDDIVLPASLAAPFTFWYLAPGDVGQGTRKADAQQLAVAATAGEIVGLLALGARGEARIGDEPLAGNHVAVLVRGHTEAALVREALARAGVASVTYGQRSVFKSHEASELERVLLAVAHPSREGLVRAALATDLLGWSAAELAALERDALPLERALEDFARYRDIAEHDDFARMLRTLAIERRVAPRLLALADGERRLTNVLHLAELLEDAATRDGLDLAGVVRFLAQARAATQRDVEAEQLRLESDERLVRILTIHASKGLQFPIVFCPFLWSGGSARRPGRPLAFHESGDAGRAMFDLGTPPADAHLALAEREAMEESLRLAYVALTRAEHRVVAVCGPLRGWESSPLAWLLADEGEAPSSPAAHGKRATQHEPGSGDERLAAAKKRAKTMRGGELRERLAALARRSGGSIAVVDPPWGVAVALPAAQPAVPAQFGARRFHGVICPRWRVTSYTGLAARSESEAPDHDALASASPEAEPPAEPASPLVADLPRGARFGEALHALFEAVDFTRLGPVEAQAREALARFGIAPAHAPAVAKLVADAVRATLDAHGRVRLGDVPRTSRVDELEFYLPAATVDAERVAAALTPDRVRAGLAPATRDTVAGVTPGYLRGFVDLAFAADGRYWIADYKSNWLGPRREDYAAPRLARAMAEHLYDLQALLYVVAVDRYLATRVRGYDYARDFGGVFYLFVRGMEPGSRHGVHFLRPDPVLVRDLGAAMTQRERLVP